MASITSICVCRKTVYDGQLKEHREGCAPYREFNNRIAQQILHKSCPAKACDWGEHKQKRCETAKDTIVLDVADGKWWAPVEAVANDGRTVGTQVV